MLNNDENNVILIEDSDSDTDSSEVEILEDHDNKPRNLSKNDGLTMLTSDYQDVLEEINKDLGISNNLIGLHDTSFAEPELTIEEVFSLPNLGLPNFLTTPDAPMHDYKDDYEKIVEENRNMMNSLKETLECPVCLTIVRSSPVPSCYNGHIVCSSCWNLTHLCPLCRVNLHNNENCFSQTANTLLDLVTLSCQYEDEGCSFQGKKTEVERHQQDCLFRHIGQEQEAVSGCSARGCHVGKMKMMGEKKTVGRRIRAITPRLTCDYCNKNFSRRYFNRHMCVNGVMYIDRNLA